MKRIYLLLLPLVFSLNTVLAQNGHKQVSYSNLALQYSGYNFNGDGNTGVFPSVASPNGYGTYLQNPAGVALLKDGFLNFSLYNQQSDYSNSYLNNTLDTEENKTKLGSLGFVYQLPVQQGSFAIGGGYNRINSQNGEYRVSGRNSESTITDAFKDPASDYYDLAFETYAIDYGDVDSTYFESIFRIGFTPGQFPGIDQEAEISYQTDMGEYSFFVATEFQENLFVGVSGGVIAGSYKYRRDFLETDSGNDYDGDFIPSDVSDEGTDIYQILTHDEIDADIIGFDFRVGAIYKITPDVNIGANVLFPSTLRVTENYYSFIETELDDGSTPFFFDMASSDDFSYRIKKPAQYSLGLSARVMDNFDFAVAAEYTNHANLELDFISDSDVDFNDEVILREQQAALDSVMNADYNKVINVKLGAGYTFNDQIKLKAGYAFLPGQSKRFEADKNVFSVALESRIIDNVKFDISGQYSLWDDSSELYYYTDFNNRVRSENMTHQVSRLNISAGIKILF